MGSARPNGSRAAPMGSAQPKSVQNSVNLSAAFQNLPFNFYAVDFANEFDLHYLYMRKISFNTMFSLWLFLSFWTDHFAVFCRDVARGFGKDQRLALKSSHGLRVLLKHSENKLCKHLKCGLLAVFFFYLISFWCARFYGAPMHFLHSAPGGFFFHALFMRHRCGRCVNHWCTTVIKRTGLVCTEHTMSGVLMFWVVSWPYFFYFNPVPVRGILWAHWCIFFIPHQAVSIFR